MTDNHNIFLKVAPVHIDMLNKIVEGYDNLAVVTTINASEGKLVLRVTPDTREDVLKILHHMPFSVEIMDGE